MLAMVLRGKQLGIEDVALPSPGPGQVLARVRACGICGSDLHYARYAEMLQAASRAERGILANASTEQALVMGHEFVAEIADLGEGVSGWQAGDRVVSVPTLIGTGGAGAHSIGYSSRYPGAYGEYILMSAPLLLRVPKALPDRLAALTEPCAVALHAFREAKVQPGERVLVMGAGPIGLLTMLWLKRGGVTVAISDPAAPRRELAARLGADLVVDPGSEEVSSALGETGGAPPVVVECVGVEGTLQQAMTLVARRGRVIVAGVCMVEDRIRPLLAINKQLTLQFVLGYTPEEFAEALAALSDGRIDGGPVVTRAVKLEDLPAAFASLGDPTDCKVVLEFPSQG
jgi:threonine dehydrogenase-like Zn-dependent dehydrogenase